MNKFKINITSYTAALKADIFSTQFWDFVFCNSDKYRFMCTARNLLTITQFISKTMEKWVFRNCQIVMSTISISSLAIFLGTRKKKKQNRCDQILFWKEWINKRDLVPSNMRSVALLILIVVFCPFWRLMSPVVTPKAEHWQMILETMVHLTALVEDAVSLRCSIFADIGYSSSPCCHIPLPP